MRSQVSVLEDVLKAKEAELLLKGRLLKIV